MLRVQAQRQIRNVTLSRRENSDWIFKFSLKRVLKSTQVENYISRQRTFLRLQTSSSSLFPNNSRTKRFEANFSKKEKKNSRSGRHRLAPSAFFIIVGENDRILRTQKEFLEEKLWFLKS
jgi:hypothetical protein